MNKVLALAPHPDDIEIGCGGSLAEYAKRGLEVHLFVATDGGRGGDAKVRMHEQEASAKIMGVNEVHWGGFVDTELENHSTPLIHALEKYINLLNPDTVLVNFHEDTHQDHRALARATYSATRHVPNVLAYETPTTLIFDPHVFMDIHASLSTKLRALNAHTSQIDRTNIQGLNIAEIALANAHFRGVQSKMPSAEAFVPIRLRL
jgi:LmbE family N-acetylglucosaminyl deacetylase